MVTTLLAYLHLETTVQQTAANSFDSTNRNREAGCGATLGFLVIRHETGVRPSRPRCALVHNMCRAGRGSPKLVLDIETDLQDPEKSAGL